MNSHLILAGALLVAGASETVNFDKAEAGKAPSGWTATQTGTGQWHTLRVDFQGSHFTVTFNGQTALDWTDETFKDAGKVGVWTKADSVTEFDDFTYGSK